MLRNEARGRSETVNAAIFSGRLRSEANEGHGTTSGARLKPLILRDQDTRRLHPLICSLLGSTIPQSRIRRLVTCLPRELSGFQFNTPELFPYLSSLLRSLSLSLCKCFENKRKNLRKHEIDTDIKGSPRKWNERIRIKGDGRKCNRGLEGREAVHEVGMRRGRREWCKPCFSLAFIKMQTADHLNTYSR